MLAKIDKSLHIINKAYWHMICHSFYRDSVIQRKPVRQQTGRDWRLLLTRRETGFFRAAVICSPATDVSTSTRRVAGSVITVASGSRVRIVFYRTGAAAAGHVINMELHVELL